MSQRERLILDSKGHSAIDQHSITGDKQWIRVKHNKKMNNKRVSPAPSNLTTQSTLTLDTNRNKQPDIAMNDSVMNKPIKDEHDIESNDDTTNTTTFFTAVEAFDNDNC